MKLWKPVAASRQALLIVLLLAISGLHAAGRAEAALNPGPTKSECFISYETQKMECAPRGTDIQQFITGKTGLPVRGLEKKDTSTLETATLSTHILGYIYDDNYFAGGTLYFTANTVDYPCRGYSYGFPYLGNYGWHDRASSMSAIQQCRVAIWEHPNYAGAQYGFYYSTYTLGPLNDKGDSVVFAQ